VETGGRSAGLVEIKEGLEPGVQVAAAGSFILKSELGKASAEHAH
jgi:cobalt-zinc-cadmium efflux system membrane fusion protein